MKTTHDLFGLMKFMGRESWRHDLQDVMDAHFGAILEETDLDFDDVGDILGEHWQMTLWGCAFEDALSQEFEGRRNPVDDYLKRRGWKESAATRAYLKALRTSVLSLYEVSEIVPGESFLARDLLRGGEPLLVHEGTATQTLRPWEKLAARIVAVGDRRILAGGLLPFSPDAVDMLMDGLRHATGKTRRAKLRLKEEVLRPLAPLFTMVWLMDALPKALGQALPDLRNRDGEEIVLHEVRFPLADGVTPDEVGARLTGVAALEPADERFWNWLDTKPSDADRAGKDHEVPSFDVTFGDGVPVLGNIELSDSFLVLVVNSAARAARGTKLLNEVLGSLVRTPLTSIQTMEQMMASRPTEPEPRQLDLPPDVETRIIHDMLDRQYRSTLDEPVGMLGNKSPRAAAKTKAGREKVAEWLKYLEHQSARSGGPADPADPMASYDFGWLWRELKVEDLRR